MVRFQPLFSNQRSHQSSTVKTKLRKGWMLSAIFLPLLLIMSGSLLEAQTPGASSNSGTSGTAWPYDEAEAQAIDRHIMCPVCPAESIDQAQVPIARQMRQIVRDQLSQGASREEILDFFAQRYGPDILASPPKSGFNLLAWLIPVVGMGAALIAGWLVIRSMAARRLASADRPVSMQADLDPYLAMVDADIGLMPSANTSTQTSNPGQPSVEPEREGGSLNGG